MGSVSVALGAGGAILAMSRAALPADLREAALWPTDNHNLKPLITPEKYTADRDG
jgi:hypothetical protein